MQSTYAEHTPVLDQVATLPDKRGPSRFHRHKGYSYPENQQMFGFASGFANKFSFRRARARPLSSSVHVTTPVLSGLAQRWKLEVGRSADIS